ncbi:prepilin-type N-terminal cleavage/methylation domain-containing protein [Microbacterium sp. NPDC056057]|uniref:prepilin-type N-terminal cleavage/methylation domain-containing protein n=1 Tax=Microbacterium sp. NPDC056057 TaxID=3345699 RepID=UPI0035DE808B
MKTTFWPRRDDSGLSLVELIVVVVLLGILAGVVGTILANSWRAQNDVTTTTEATNSGQLVGQSVERAVRNGVALRITDGGSTLWVRTAYTNNRQCQIFWVSSDGGLHMASAATGAALPSPTSWASDVTKVPGSTAFFTLVGSNSVDYAFNVGTAAAPVRISGSASLRTSPSGGGSCWT